MRARAASAAPVTGALDIDISVPERGIAIELAARPGRITAVIGPNGSGKSTMLGAIDGMLPAQGRVILDGRDIIGLAPYKRGIGSLSQSAPLFTHMTLEQNVAYGPRSQGASRASARATARELLAEVGLGELGPRKADALSGGQARRAAIARTLAPDPSIVLLDEPFAGLDVGAAAQLRALISRLLHGRTVLLVTHDLVDLVALADDIAVLEPGRILAHGTREEILHRPPSPFVAQLAGKDLVVGELDGDAVEAPDGTIIRGAVLEAPEISASAAAQGAETGKGTGRGAVFGALVDPAKVAILHDDEEARAAGAQIVEGPVTGVDVLGSAVVVRACGIGALVGTSEAARALPKAGDRVRLAIERGSVSIYPVRHGLHAQRSDLARA